MSNFHRAYAAAVEVAGLSQGEIAARCGLAQSTVSRAMQGDFVPELESLGRLLKALDNESDRLHCQHAYLLDHVVDEFRDRLTISLGAVNADRPRPKDSITRALETLDAEAGENPSLRRLLAALAEIVGERQPGEGGQTSYGKSVDDLLDEKDAAPKAGDGSKPGGGRRVAPVSLKPRRGSKR